jgi:hypothetical protein
MQDSASADHDRNKHLNPYTSDHITYLGLDHALEPMETADSALPAPTWLPDLDMHPSIDASTDCLLDQDNIWPHNASGEFNASLSYQPNGVLSANLTQSLSEQPIFSWPGMPDPFQYVLWSVPYWSG